MKKEKNFTVPASQLLIHQGDVIIERVNSLPENAKKIPAKPLALGEFSGHKHIAVAERENLIDFYEADGKIYLVNKAQMKIRHELANKEWTGEHHTLVLEPDVYKISIQRVYDPF